MQAIWIHNMRNNPLVKQINKHKQSKWTNKTKELMEKYAMKDNEFTLSKQETKILVKMKQKQHYKQQVQNKVRTDQNYDI